jgi:hypothetical protein
MKVIPLDDTTLTLPAVAEMARDETVVLTRKGRPLVAIKDASGSD